MEEAASKMLAAPVGHFFQQKTEISAS